MEKKKQQEGKGTGHNCHHNGNGRRINIFHSFLNPQGEINVTKNDLPHWHQEETWVFVTWRLKDSLPKSILERWREDRLIWIKLHPEPWDKNTEMDYHQRFSGKIEDWLDQGRGSCLLKDPVNARFVKDALWHFNGDRYEIATFVVMPNHVHILFRPLGENTIPEILKSWKGYTARKINKRVDKKGTLWQNEYYDRLIRNERHFCKVVEYIRKNPEKAKLREGEFILEGGLPGS